MCVCVFSRCLFRKIKTMVHIFLSALMHALLCHPFFILNYFLILNNVIRRISTITTTKKYIYFSWNTEWVFSVVRWSVLFQIKDPCWFFFVLLHVTDLDHTLKTVCDHVCRIFNFLDLSHMFSNGWINLLCLSLIKICMYKKKGAFNQSISWRAWTVIDATNKYI